MAESEDNILPEILPSVARKYVERLKALRPSWKPSEYQKNRLSDIITGLKRYGNNDWADFFETLYNDLKKLM